MYRLRATPFATQALRCCRHSVGGSSLIVVTAADVSYSHDIPVTNFAVVTQEGAYLPEAPKKPARLSQQEET